MKKTLFIQIDNNSLPEGCGEDVEVLDCRCINDFCSIVGDALVNDLKDEDGKPFYRLINPVGRLLMDFKTINEGAFNEVISKWYEYLGELLHKGTLESDMTIKFPKEYIDWLLQNDNPYYESVGKELQKKKGVIAIPSEDVIEDIMASLTYKISHTLRYISFAVFSNPIIRNSSFLVKRVKVAFPLIHLLSYSQWNNSIIEEEKLKKATKLDSCKDFYVDGICLGEQVPDINTDWYVSKKENVCNKLEFQRLEKDGRMLNSLLSCLMGKNADYRHLSYNNIYSHLVSLEFKVIKDPCVEYDSSWHCYRLRAVLKKETKEFVCSIEFYGGDKGNSTNIDIAKNDKGTLKSICVELVNANSTPTENISTSQETYNDYSDRDDGGYYNNDDGLEPILGAGEIGFLW